MTNISSMHLFEEKKHKTYLQPFSRRFYNGVTILMANILKMPPKALKKGGFK